MVTWLIIPFRGQDYHSVTVYKLGYVESIFTLSFFLYFFFLNKRHWWMRALPYDPTWPSMFAHVYEHSWELLLPMSHRLQRQQRQQELPRSVSNFTKSKLKKEMQKSISEMQKSILDAILFRKKDIEFNSAFSLELYLLVPLEPSADSKANYSCYEYNWDAFWPTELKSLWKLQVLSFSLFYFLHLVDLFSEYKIKGNKDRNNWRQTFAKWLKLFIADIDECEKGVHNCTKEQVCVNTFGGHRCMVVECPRFRNASYIKTSPL